MYLKTQVNVDFAPLDNLLDSMDIPRDGHTKLMMNNNTVRALTGKCFYDDRRQTYHGFEIIEGYDCGVGEVIVLVNYESMKGE